MAKTHNYTKPSIKIIWSEEWKWKMNVIKIKKENIKISNPNIGKKYSISITLILIYSLDCLDISVFKDNWR